MDRKAVLILVVVGSSVLILTSILTRPSTRSRPGPTVSSENPMKDAPLPEPPAASVEEVLAKTEDRPDARFQEVALRSGLHFRMTFLTREQGQVFKINLYDHGCGLAVGDIDGDSDEDVYFANQLGPNQLFRNRGDGTFEDVTEEAGVALADRICASAAFNDFDNDGDQDLYVTSTRGGNVLFQNQGHGTFVDVTDAAGVKHVGHSQAGAFFDYDRDGYLDLFLTNTASWTLEEYDAAQGYFVGPNGLVAHFRSPQEYNVLYRNQGDGTFTDVTEAAGLRGGHWDGDVAIADYDEDGDPDLFVANMFGQSHLYRNEGGGKFTDVSGNTLKRTSWGAIGSRFFDVDNDGLLDLLLVDMHSDMWIPGPLADLRGIDERVKYKYVSGPYGEKDGRLSEKEIYYSSEYRIAYETVVFGNCLFRNLGNGEFEEVSDQRNLETFWPWGIAEGDFDNDGDVDVFMPSGMGYPFEYWKNYLMMNDGNGTFEDQSQAAGIEPPARGIYLETEISNTNLPFENINKRKPTRSSRCAATGDFNGDGRLDLLVNNFNDYAYYFKNNYPLKNYIAFKLTGTKSNRDAVGAVVRLFAGGLLMVRQVQAAGGYLSQSTKVLHFGLGERKAVEKIEIRWPSGLRQVVESPEINRLHSMTEP